MLLEHNLLFYANFLTEAGVFRLVVGGPRVIDDKATQSHSLTRHFYFEGEKFWLADSITFLDFHKFQVFQYPIRLTRLSAITQIYGELHLN